MQFGNVVDADPRIISNLIVDQTIANYAALVTALMQVGSTNPYADAQHIIDAKELAASKAAEARAAQKSEDAAAGKMSASKAARDTAANADADAQATRAAYVSAAALANAADDRTSLAFSAVSNFYTSLAPVGSTIGNLDIALLDAAISAASNASASTAAVVTALTETTPSAHPNLQISVVDLSHAQSLASNAATLVAQLTALQAILAFGSAVTQEQLDVVGEAALLATQNANDALLMTDQLAASATAAGLNASIASESLASAQGQLDAHSRIYADAVAASNAADAAASSAADHLVGAIADHGLDISADGSITIEHRTPDIGLSPPNSGWMTLFGQFFDHGLDLVTKGGNGTVYIPLQPDDPLIAGPNGIFEDNPLTRATEGDDLAPQLRFMAVTRTTVFDAEGNTQNTTTPYVDQNQTYTSVASHQVFLREYKTVDGKTVATGRLLDSPDGSIASWTTVKAHVLNFLGIKLTDFDVHDVPLLLTDPYGRFIPDPVTGYAQVVTAVDADGVPIEWVSGTPGQPVDLGTTAFVGTGHAFLNDIAHHAAPGLVDVDARGVRDGVKSTVQTADADIDVDGDGIYDHGVDTLSDVNRDGVIDGKDFFADDGTDLTYDDEMLGAHFITGDGRGNENIGLITVHYVFHAEHNRLIEANKDTLIGSGDVAIVNEWLRPDASGWRFGMTQAQLDAITAETDPAAKAAAIDALDWDGERMFQAARFVTEMQYQHMVFEEFARRLQVNVDPFVFTNSADLDASIVAEFAHVVYRFGHSMLTDTVDRLDAALGIIDGDSKVAGAQQVGLIEAFLNPLMFTESGPTIEAASGAIIRGMSRQVGAEIDEFVPESLRNNLVGLPLDLAAINIARGRETGSPTLNDAREQLYAMSGDAQVKPYTSWLDFAQNLKNPISVVNFIAAYGTHASISSATTLDAKRDAAMNIVFGGTDAPADSVDFLTANGTYAGGSLGGLNAVDMWIGGLAERLMEFGGQLGSTFNFVFEYQMEHLQNGDRFYYLSRTQGMNLFNLLEANTFTDIIMRNTDLGDLHATHMPALSMSVPDMILELDRLVAQQDYNGDLAGNDPTWGSRVEDMLLGPKVFRQDGTARVGEVDAHGHQILDGGILKFQGGEHVVLGGTEGNDRLYGDKGMDTLWGDAGNDYLNAGMEADQVYGGEGDDIIEDPFGNDFLRGEAGDDVVISSHGLDFLFGGEGQDFVAAATDTVEIFAGPGNDFVQGGTSNDILMGNEGDDWIEGGEGFDIIAGENSELFFNSPIVGHDIMNGQGNDTDYDAENGDDIMVQSAGIQRSNGMDGFDWAIHKGDPNAADSDLSNLLELGIVTPAFILRDRFDSVEGLSGWNFDDTLTGASKLIAGFVSELTQAGVDRIDGLASIIATAGDGVDPRINRTATAVVLTDARAQDGGEIILGGKGSDVITGSQGNDILDGDAWLNVRISVRTGKDATGPVGDEIFTVNDLSEIITSGSGTTDPLYLGKSLAHLMRTGVVNPGQLQSVREILNSDGSRVGDARSTNDGGELGLGFAGDIDVAVFRDVYSNYIIEGAGSTGGGADVDGDGFISVTHAPPGGGGGGGNRIDDGIDHIRNFEVLQFADTRISLNKFDTNEMASGSISFSISDDVGLPGLTVGDTLTVENGVPDTTAPPNVVDVDGVPAISEFTFTWQFEQTPGLEDWAPVTDAGGNPMLGRTLTITPDLGLDGARLRVVGQFHDAEGMPENVASTASDPIGAAAVTVATLGPDVPLVGTNGNDAIDALAGDDVVFGLAGDDTIIGGPGNDFVDGGAGVDTLAFTAAGETDANAVFAPTEAGTVTVTFGGDVDEFTNIEVIQFADGGTITGAAADARAGIIRGTEAGETLTGGALDEWFVGHGGDDIIAAGDGDDNIVWNVGDGLDTVDGGGNAVADTMYINGSQGADVFTIYTRSAAREAGIDVGGDTTEIVITRNGNTTADRIALLDNIEELVINTRRVGLGTDAARGDTVVVVGDFTETSLALNTITIEGTGGDDTIDISRLMSAHRIVLRSNGGHDTIIGTLRPQDVIELPAGETLADSAVYDGWEGMTTLVTLSGSVTYTTPATPEGAPQIVEFGQVSHSDNGSSDPTGDPAVDPVTDPTGDPVTDPTEDPAGDPAVDPTEDPASGSGDGSGSDPSPDPESPADDPSSDPSGDPVSDPVEGPAADPGTVPTEDPSGDPTNGDGTGAAAAVVLIGSSLDDTLVGDAGDDILIGEAGDDTLLGLDGDDSLVGGAGADYLVAAAGNDLVFGNAGNDFVLAGTGDDTVMAGSGNDTVFADAGDDLIFGEAGRDVVHAGNGNDTIFAAVGDGNDVYHGDGGIDTLDHEAISANAIIDLGSTGIGSASSAETGTDTLSSIENVLGGSGNDTIYASNAVNVLNGGAGNDVFVFRTARAADGDTIEGFAAGDRVDLAPIYGGLAFDFETAINADFTMAGSLRLETVDGDTLIEGNIDADAEADFQIRIVGVTDLDRTNFV